MTEPAREPASNVRFIERVADLRASWAEAREAATLGGQRTRDGQFRVLLLLHAWCEECLADIRGVYGEELPASISVKPCDDDEAPGFRLRIGEETGLTATLQQTKPKPDGWQVILAVQQFGASNRVVPSRGRKNYWTRSRVQDLLVGMLSLIEHAAGHGEATDETLTDIDEGMAPETHGARNPFIEGFELARAADRAPSVSGYANAPASRAAR